MPFNRESYLRYFATPMSGRIIGHIRTSVRPVVYVHLTQKTNARI